MFWRQDKPEREWHDRAFAHVYANKLPLNFTDFHFQPDEVAGLVRVKAGDCLDLLMDKKTEIPAIKISSDGVKNIEISGKDFLTASNENAVVKYGHVLQSIMQICDK